MVEFRGQDFLLNLIQVSIYKMFKRKKLPLPNLSPNSRLEKVIRLTQPVSIIRVNNPIEKKKKKIFVMI